MNMLGVPVAMMGIQLGNDLMQSNSIRLHDKNRISREKLEMAEGQMWRQSWCP